MSFFKLFYSCCPFLMAPDIDDCERQQRYWKTESKEGDIHRTYTYEMSEYPKNIDHLKSSQFLPDFLDYPDCCFDILPSPKKGKTQQQITSASSRSKRAKKLMEVSDSDSEYKKDQLSRMVVNDILEKITY